MLRGTNCWPSQTGAILDRVSRVFFSVVQADTNPERQKIQEDVVPKLAAHVGVCERNLSRYFRERFDMGPM